MTKPEMLQMMRLLSAVESIMLERGGLQSHLAQWIADALEVLEREILKESK